MGQEFKSCLVVWLWLGVSHEVVDVSWAWRMQGDSFLSGRCWWLLAGASVSPHTGLFMSCMSVSPHHESSLPQNRQSRWAWRKLQHLYDPSLKVTCCRFCNIQLGTLASLIHKEEVYTGAFISESRYHWKTSWRLSTTRMLCGVA